MSINLLPYVNDICHHAFIVWSLNETISFEIDRKINNFMEGCVFTDKVRFHGMCYGHEIMNEVDPNNMLFACKQSNKFMSVVHSKESCWQSHPATQFEVCVLELVACNCYLRSIGDGWITPTFINTLYKSQYKKVITKQFHMSINSEVLFSSQ